MNRCCNYSTCLPCRVSSSSPWWQAPRSRGELWSGFPIWQVGKKIHGDPKSTQFLTGLLTTYSGVINGLYRPQLYSPTYGLKSNKSRKSLPEEFSPDRPVFQRVVFFVCVFDFGSENSRDWLHVLEIKKHENQEKNALRKDPQVLKLHICYMFFSISISHFCYWTQWRSLSQLRVSVSGMDRIHPVMVRMRLSRWFEDTWGKNVILSKSWCITRIRIQLVTSQFFVVVIIRWITLMSISYHN